MVIYYKCDYDVMSSGGLDWGMRAVVRPYICNDCNIVTDVLVGLHGKEYPRELLEHPDSNEIPGFARLEDEEKQEFYTCTECKGKNIILWNPRWRRCPKCGGRMLRDESKGPEGILCWD